MNNVHTGLWTDHSQRFGFRMLPFRGLLLFCLTTVGTQLLVTNFKSNLITNALGILVSIACSRLFRMVLHCVEIFRSFQNLPTAPENLSKPPESLAWDNFRAALDAVSQGTIHLGPQQSNHPNQRKRESLRFFGIGLAFFIVFLACLVFGVLTALFATTKTALSRDPRCGLYIPQDNTWPNILNISTSYQLSAQAEGGTLAETCLNSVSPDCGTFSDPKFSTTVQNSTCPF